MGIETVIGITTLAATVGSSYNQYRTAKKMERQQEKAENVQAGLAKIENRKEAIRRIARERVARANVSANATARGVGGGADSGTAGLTGGIRSTLGSSLGQIASQNFAGEQLSSINQELASLNTDMARDQAIGTVSNAIFQGVGGFNTLFASAPSGGINLAGNQSVNINSPTNMQPAPPNMNLFQ